MEDGYRIQITNFPPKTTRNDIIERLKLNMSQCENLVLPEDSNTQAPLIAYIVTQKSSTVAKRLIRSWHNQLWSDDKPYQIKCQLEINVEYFNFAISFPFIITSVDGSRTPSTISTVDSIDIRKKTKRSALRHQFSNMECIKSPECDINDPLQTDSELKSLIDVNDLPTSLDYTYITLVYKETDKEMWVYSITNEEDSNEIIELRIYSTKLNNESQLRVKRHRNALQQLQCE